jgi:deoxyribodipyrimidine photolyase-related protein
MMVYVFDKMKDERKKMILSEADKFIKSNTA